MHAAAQHHRGPAPWREPRPDRRPWTDADRLVIVAWCQLGALLIWSAWLAMFAWFVMSPDIFAMACFDGDEAACSAPPPSLTLLVAPAAMWSLVLVLAAAAVVATHQHRRGAASLNAALLMLAAAPVAAFAAGGLAGVPLLFSL